MTTLFLTCLAVGGVVLVAQLVLSLVGIGAGGAEGHGFGHDALHDVAHDAHGPSHGVGHGALEGLHLFSVRSLAAAVAFFGVGGLGARAVGLPAPVAVLVALVAGMAASIATAAAMRALLRLERDATVRLDRAVGAAATVYVPIPGDGAGAGKVLLTLQGRTVECQAVTTDPRVLPTGTAVTVVDVRGADLVEVVPTPSTDGAR
jgi:membrane protein implicated in regulation of membrane protease activity